MTDGLIHVVEDSTRFYESVHPMLSASGFAVHGHHDAHAFLDAVTVLPLGCALVHLTVPERDGLALLETMKRRGIGVPVIVMADNADVPMAVAAMKAGAADFIERPFAPATLVAAVEATRPRQVALPPSDNPQLANLLTRLPDLSGREREILEAIVSGQATKAIARRLAISCRTVDAHRARIRDKLGIAGLPNLVRLALAAGVSQTYQPADDPAFLRLVWSSAYESGHATIDRQHRKLFDHVNSLLAGIVGERPKGEVMPRIAALLADLEDHFHDEEKILRSIGYPDAAGHGEIHATLVARAMRMADDVSSDQSTLGDLLNFLAYDMVAKHMLSEDRKFFGLLP